MHFDLAPQNHRNFNIIGAILFRLTDWVNISCGRQKYNYIMNIVFGIIITACVGYMLFTAPQSVMPALLSGGEASVSFSVKLFVIYGVWISVMQVLEKSGIDEYIAKALTPITKRLFPNESAECHKYITLNLSANLLGMGGAATPLGIKSVGLMQSQKNKIMLAVINATSIQIIPTTVLSMRAAMGAQTDIMLPATIINVFSTALAITLVAVLVKR